MPRSASLRTGYRDQWMQYIRGSVLESAAATFTENTISLPVVVSQGLVVEIWSIEWELPTLGIADISATDDIAEHRVQLTKASKTAILRLDDPDLIAAHHLKLYSPSARTAEKGSPTTVGAMGLVVHNFPQPVLLPFEQIYLSAATAGGGSAYRYNVRLGFTTVKISTRQVVELIQAVT